ncbi:MAG: high-affinity branched-chain amino acid ABC transporter permease LivM [Deltaproteobacteria bacterium]|jgi:branched-chain amino acid transport system permease protein|nr:high-affinity branched-chain amino acid ABC transporter permease LivM [Deltaproteobacteria bacterium]
MPEKDGKDPTGAPLRRPREKGRGKKILLSILRPLKAGLWLSLVAFPLVTFKFEAETRQAHFLPERIPLLLLICFGAAVAFDGLGWLKKAFGPGKRAGGILESPPEGLNRPRLSWVNRLLKSRFFKPASGVLLIFLAVLPFISSPYGVNVYITALIYITLGLGLNIVVGVSGLLNLGYVAFYAVGAYTYAILNAQFGLSFWVCLPLGALSATLLGFILGLPLLRVSGDYLAIVTLGFGEITRLVLTNIAITNGPRGIANIPPPSLFGFDLNQSVKPFLLKLGLIHSRTDLDKVLIYLIILMAAILTVAAVHRLENSRLGRAWLALREDETACQAVGVNRAGAKLTAFTLGSTWAGLAGVVFASQISFINPQSFTFMQSVMILSIVVLGGMGSIPGVVCGAVILILLPEYLRFFADYRMLLFGLLMVVMMVFRPEGLIKSARYQHIYRAPKAGEGDPSDSASGK